MSFTSENVLSVVQNNPEEVAGVLNCMQSLGPAVLAFGKLCSDNKIRPLRRSKGQYCRNKRAPSAYNMFTKSNKDHNDLKDLAFADRAKKMGELWNKVRSNKKEHAKYVQMAADAKDECDKANNPDPVVVEVVVAPVADAPKVKKVKAVKPSKKVKPAPKKKKAPPVVVKDAGDVSEIDLDSDSD